MFGPELREFLLRQSKWQGRVIREKSAGLGIKRQIDVRNQQ